MVNSLEVPFDPNLLDELEPFRGADPTPSGRYLVLVDFSERDCTNCLYSTLPLLENRRQAFQGRVDFVAVAHDIPRLRLRQLVKVGQIPYPILRDKQPGSGFRVSLIDLRAMLTIRVYLPNQGDPYEACLDDFFEGI